MSASSPAALDEKAPPSSLDAIDDRLRLGLAVVFVIAVVTVNSLPAAALALVMAFGLALASRIPAGMMIRRMLIAEYFVIALFLTLPFTVPGEPVFSIFGLGASQEGFVRALVIALRINAVVLAILSLLWPLGPVRLARAMRGVGVSPRLTTLMVLMLRYVHVFSDELVRLRRAARARGFRPDTNMHTLRTFAYLIGMLCVRAAERADRVSWAMRARGFDGALPVRAMPTLRAADFAVPLLLVLVIALLPLVEYVL